MEETPELEVNPPQIQLESPEAFFDMLHPTDLKNVNRVRELFETFRSERGIAGFIGVVGSSSVEQQGREPDDIDLLVGIQQDLGNIDGLAPIGVSRRRFERWKESLHDVIEQLKAEGVKVTEDEQIRPSHSSEDVTVNDGKLTLTFPQGKQIELLCDQDPASHQDAYDASLQPHAA